MVRYGNICKVRIGIPRKNCKLYYSAVDQHMFTYVHFQRS